MGFHTRIACRVTRPGRDTHICTFEYPIAFAKMVLYMNLQTNGRLNGCLSDIDVQASEKFDRQEKQMV